MISVQVQTRQRFGLISGKIREGARRATVRLALAVPKVVAAEIAAEVRPDGGPQKRNSPGTVRRKGHARPLVDKGVLSNPNRWMSRIRQYDAIVELPAERRDVQRTLFPRGYRFAVMRESKRWPREVQRIARDYRVQVVG